MSDDDKRPPRRGWVRDAFVGVLGTALLVGLGVALVVWAGVCVTGPFR